MAVVFFCHHLLSPIASIFGSGAPYAARTFLSCVKHQRQTVAVLSDAKVIIFVGIRKQENEIIQIQQSKTMDFLNFVSYLRFEVLIAKGR